MRQKNGHVEILAALPGVEAKDVDVRVTPEDVLIRAAITDEHTAKDGTLHVCELACGDAFRSIHLPAKIDPGTVKAEYRNGMLRLTASVAEGAAPQQVDIKVA